MSLSYLSPSFVPVHQLANLSQLSSDLSNNQLDEAAKTCLNQGSWPLMTRLVVHSTLCVRVEGTALIHKSTSWAPLHYLSLSLHLDSFCHVMVLLCHQLRQLDLAY